MKTVVVTGATSGIGYAVCEALLSNGYAVIGVGRDAARCEAAEERLRAAGSRAVRFLCADLMQQSEVKRVARQIGEIIDRDFDGRLHALISNAGCVRRRYMTTEEGYEQQFALNYLAGFLLTHELMPQIRRSDAAVIFTSSASHKMMKMRWDDLMFKRRYRPLYAYKQSKLGNMLLALKLREMGVRACGVDPGLVNTDIGNKNTDGVVSFVWKYRKRHGTAPEESAKIFLALCENGFSGLYYGLGGKEIKASAEVSAENAARLWGVSEKLCGIE